MLSSLPCCYTGWKVPDPDALPGKKQPEGCHASRRGVAPPLQLWDCLHQGPLPQWSRLHHEFCYGALLWRSLRRLPGCGDCCRTASRHRSSSGQSVSVAKCSLSSSAFRAGPPQECPYPKRSTARYKGIKLLPGRRPILPVQNQHIMGDECYADQF